MNRKKHNKKMIAPIVITVLLLIYVIIYGTVLMQMTQWNILALLGAVPLAMLAGGMVCALVSRIREIKSGEEDDLDRY